MERLKLIRCDENNVLIEETVIQLRDGEKLLLQSDSKTLGEFKFETDKKDEIKEVDFINYIDDHDMGNRAIKLGFTLGTLACKYCGIVSHGAQISNVCEMCGEPYLEHSKNVIKHIRPLNHG